MMVTRITGGNYHIYYHSDDWDIFKQNGLWSVGKFNEQYKLDIYNYFKTKREALEYIRKTYEN